MGRVFRRLISFHGEFGPRCKIEVPYGVYWFRACVNVLAWAAAFWMVLTAVSLAGRRVRWRRSREGRCRACGYPLVLAEGPCPEWSVPGGPRAGAAAAPVENRHG